MTSKSIESDILKRNFEQRQQYVENVIIVWLNTTLETNDHTNTKKIIQQFQIISNDIEVFNDSDICIDYITNLKHQCVLLIVSNSIDQCILKVTQDLSSIFAVYILDLLDTINHEECSESSRKVKGIFININELIKQIKSDIYRIEYDLLGIEIVDVSNISLPFSNNLNKQEHSFMHSQLLKNIFLKFQDNSILELVEYCRKMYATNPVQLNIVDEFERDYDQSKAIHWYTKDTFLYKLINKALRTRHVETLYNMRTFIRHLHQQLVQLCPTDTRASSTSILTLYRGQRMATDEFEKLKTKQGGLLSISNFLSTSASQEIALIYAGESNDEMTAVVFQITLDLNYTTDSSFACIERFSHFGETEHEWLFSMGTVFRIGKIELLNKIWYIHLTLTNDQDEMLGKLTTHMSKLIQMERPNPLVPLCRLFARMDEFKFAIELCEKYIDLEDGWEIQATLYDTLALVQVEEEENNLALRYHQEALDIVVKHVDKDDPLLAPYHNNVAISSSAAKRDQQAIEHYQIAINLELKATQPDYTSVAYAYDSMGVILFYVFNKYDEALYCYKHALELMIEHLPSAHPDILSVYRTMADIYEIQNETNKALDVLYKCLDAEEKSFEPSSHDIVITCQHIAEIYKKQKRFKEASEMLKKCHNLEAARPLSEDFSMENVDVDALFAKIFRSNNN